MWVVSIYYYFMIYYNINMLSTLTSIIAHSEKLTKGHFSILSARNSPKEISGANGKFLPKLLLFHLRHPNSKTSEPKFWQILSPKNSFAKTSSALKPHALPEYLEGRTPKEKHPLLFQKKFHPRQIRNARSVFSFGVAGVLASAWGFLRAYASVSLHHARRACEVITSLCFGNRCEFGTIETPNTKTQATA